MFMSIGKWVRFAMGIAFLTVGLISSAVHAQPRRPGRTAQLAAQQLPANNCTTEDADVARTHRRAGLAAFETHDWATCVSEYTVSVARCATPEARFNLGFCLESDQQFAQALEQYERLQRDNTLPSGITPDQLERTIATVRARMPHTAVAPVVVAQPTLACSTNLRTDPRNCGRCGNICANGQTCNAGSCRVQQTTTQPITTPPRSHLASRALIIGGGVVAVTGAVLLGIGVAANNDAGNLCEATTNTPRCLVATRGDPRDYTSLTPIGGAMLGVGATAAIIGTVLEVLHPNAPNPALHGTVSVAPTANGLVVFGTF